MTLPERGLPIDLPDAARNQQRQGRRKSNMRQGVAARSEREARWPAAPARESRELDCARAGDAGERKLGFARAGGSDRR